MINYRVGGSVGDELVIDGVVSLCFVEGHSAMETDSFDLGLKSEGRLLFMEHDL